MRYRSHHSMSVAAASLCIAAHAGDAIAQETSAPQVLVTVTITATVPARPQQVAMSSRVTLRVNLPAPIPYGSETPAWIAGTPVAMTSSQPWQAQFTPLPAFVPFAQLAAPWDSIVNRDESPRRRRRPLLGPGLGFLAGGYVLGLVSLATSGDPWPLVPVIGAFVHSARAFQPPPCAAERCSAESISEALALFSGVLQATGLVMIIVDSQHVRGKSTVRHWGFAPSAAGVGAMVSGEF